MDTERERIQKILAGDMTAFGSLIDDYQRLVSHIVFRMLPNDADREEVCQEVFIKVYRNLDRFGFRCKLSTWIGRIAYNTCISYLKKHRLPLLGDLPEGTPLHFPGAPAADGKSKMEAVAAVQPLSDELMIQQETKQLLQQEIGRLPPKFRAILTLFHLDGLSHAEIGEIMDLPTGTVKSHLFRARQLLKKSLTKKWTAGELQEIAGAKEGTHETPQR